MPNALAVVVELIRESVKDELRNAHKSVNVIATEDNQSDYHTLNRWDVLNAQHQCFEMPVHFVSIWHLHFGYEESYRRQSPYPWAECSNAPLLWWLWSRRRCDLHRPPSRCIESFCRDLTLFVDEQKNWTDFSPCGRLRTTTQRDWRLKERGMVRFV